MGYFGGRVAAVHQHAALNRVDLGRAGTQIHGLNRWAISGAVTGKSRWGIWLVGGQACSCRLLLEGSIEAQGRAARDARLRASRRPQSLFFCMPPGMVKPAVNGTLAPQAAWPAGKFRPEPVNKAAGCGIGWCHGFDFLMKIWCDVAMEHMVRIDFAIVNFAWSIRAELIVCMACACQVPEKTGCKQGENNLLYFF